MTDTLQFSEYAILDLYATLIDRDLCPECGGSGRNVTEIDGEAEFEPCNCSYEVERVLRQYFPLVTEFYQAVMMYRFDETDVEWGDRVKGIPIMDRLRTIMEIIVSHYLPRNCKISSVFIDEGNRLKLTVIKTTDKETPFTFTGDTFGAAFKKAIGATYEVR